jgi:uncharacterized phage protein gp47/JayE
MAAVGEAAYPTPSELLATILVAIVFGYTSQGLSPPNVLPGSDHYKRAEAYSNRIAIAIANNKISAAASNPLTAVGSDLIALAAIFGLQPRPAAPAAGAVLVAAASTVTIPAGFVGTSPDGQVYKTISTKTVANGGSVDVIALAPGFSSNQDPGTKITWSSAAIGGLAPQATVDSAGLVGGIDADNDDRLRTRLLRKLSAPPVGGNASSVGEWAEAASASVEAPYVYAGVRGPASYDVAVTAVGGTRLLAAPTLAIVRAAILAQMPGQNDLNVTSVTDQAVDVVISIDLPLPLGAGVGGGFRDAAPWPAELAKVTAFNSGTGTATVSSTAGPVVGQSIGYWDPAYADPVTGIVIGIMREGTVASVGGGAGAWTITLQGAWVVSPLGGYLSAGAVSLVAYAAAFAAGVALLGPGEKTSLPDLLPDAARQPATGSGMAPPNLSHRLLDAVDLSFPEVADIDYAATYTHGTTTTQTAPIVPATTADPPGILVLGNLAFIQF